MNGRDTGIIGLYHLGKIKKFFLRCRKRVCELLHSRRQRTIIGNARLAVVCLQGEYIIGSSHI